MHYLGKVPFLRLFLPFAMGIISGYHLGTLFDIPLWALLCLLFLVVIFHRFINISYRLRWINGLLVNIFLYCFAVQWIVDSQTNPEIDETNSDDEQCLILEVNSVPQQKKNYVKFMADVLYGIDTCEPGRTGSLMVYLKTKVLPDLDYNDLIICNGRISNIDGPKNPGEFDYRRYMLNQGVSGQIWLESLDWQILRKDRQNVFSCIYEFKSVLNVKLDSLFHDKNDLNVARAMLTGDNTDFDSELRDKFSGVGAMHILCVSGLHVGIIFILLNSMLSFLNKSHFGRLVKSLLLLVFIWLYAIVTGLSPSVIRASTMFSFIIAGMLMRQKPNIYNSLFASAFFLLVADPLMITSVGFQLSYLAVIAIVAIQPLLYNMVRFKHLLPDKAWAIVCVSIAAQTGTAPLAIMYFNQFPNYFILTNLIVIPLSAVILYSGFAYLAFSGLGALSFIPSKSLLYSVKLLNYSTGLIYEFPFPVTEGIFMDTTDTLFFYSGLSMLLFYIYFKNNSMVFITLILMIIYTASSSFSRWQTLKRKEIIEYSIRGHTARDYVCGKDHVFMADSSLLNDKNKMTYHVHGNWFKMGLKNPRVIKIEDTCLLFLDTKQNH